MDPKHFFLLLLLVEVNQGCNPLPPGEIENPSANSSFTKCRTKNGNECLFPFIDGNILYKQCAPFGGQFWCAISVHADKSYDKWEYCDPNSCPLPQTPCSSCDSCPINTKQQRVPPTHGADYFAEYLGGAVIKLFQSLESEGFEQVPSDYITNTDVPFWKQIPKQFGVYMFFMSGINDHGVVTNEWNKIKSLTKLSIAEQKSNILKPWYLGKAHDLRERFGDHNSDQDGAITKWRNLLGYTIKPALTSAAGTLANNYHFTNLYYTFIPLRSEFDTVLIEMIFLNLFNFPNNCADNFDRRNTAANPPKLDQIAFSSQVDYYDLTKKILNNQVLWDVNRFFPFLYQEARRNPIKTPPKYYTQDDILY